MVFAPVGPVIMDLAYMTLWEAGYFLPPNSPKGLQTSTKPVEKGCCRHCSKKIGRGLRFHEKACKERK
jgi:hypothetical protein